MGELIETKKFYWGGGGYSEVDTVAHNKQRAPGKSPKYIKGPIPLDWLSSAAKLPGKALAVAIMLWFLAGVTRSEEFKPERWLQKLFGTERKAFSRALTALEGAKLIIVSRRVGKTPLVRIISGQREFS